MSGLLDRLLNLRSLSFASEDVELRFARPLPAWVWVGIIVACFVIAAWSYSRLLGSLRARVALAGLRGLAFALLAFIIAGPELVRQNERVEQDWVVVMADRSSSMTVADVPGTSGAKVTRDEQLRQTMRDGSGVFGELSSKRNVLFTGFDSTSFDLAAEPAANGFPASVNLGEPGGRRTMLGQSLDQMLRRIAARPVAGIVLLSDGRSPDQPGRALLRQLQARRIPIFPVPLGSEVSLADLAITRMESPGAAFVGDLLPVQVQVESLGGKEGAAGGGGGGRVELVDAATDTVIDTHQLAGSAAGTPERVTLLAKPDKAGATNYIVRIVPDGPDLSADNNRSQVRIDVADRPIRVVYFDGYPRWEYRYLKNILVREQSIRTSALLLASERRSIQDGNEVLDTLPRTSKDWQGFDVIVMGDVRPEVFSSEQIAQIRELVSQRGAGLLWIGGSGATPGAWRGTPLADLIPFTLPAEGLPGAERSGIEPWLKPVFIKPGAAAGRYGVLQLSGNPDDPWPKDLLTSELGWPLMRWAQRITPSMLKPTTEVLATATGEGESSGQSLPLVMSMRYGAGRIVYVATDETWRYRYCRGEVLTERFWIPLVRLLARESLGRSGKPAIMTASPEQVQVGQQVQLSVQLLDQGLIEQRPASVRARLLRAAEPGGPPPRPIEVTLVPEVQEDAAGGGQASAATFVTTWVASEPGLFTAEPAEAILGGLDVSARFEVVAPDDEMRFPQTDHGALETLAKETGGQVLTPDRLSELPSLLPNRELRILGVPDVETLWDKPLMFALMLLLLAAEWLGRRLIKLA